MSKLVYGIGINDADYIVAKFEKFYDEEGTIVRRLAWQCPSYTDWKNMLQRCSTTFKEKYPTYKNVSCCNEWIYFSNFKNWRETQGAIEDKQLDKDILVLGNKYYSPKTCVYVNPMTNIFIISNNANRGKYPLGVCWNKACKKFGASCSNPFTKIREFLGYHCNELEAHEAWRKRKHELAQLVAETESDPRVVEALKKRYSAEEWYNNKTKIGEI